MGRKPTYEELEQRVRELEELLEKSGEPLKWDVLTLLAREWDTHGPPGIVDNSDLLQRLQVKQELLESALAELEAVAITAHDAMGFATFLTPEGYEIAKRGDRKRPLAEQIREMG